MAGHDGGPPRRRAQEYYADANKDTTMATMAKACCRRILILNPRHIRARKMLAALFLKDKNFADAETECRAALLLDPTDLTARLGLASALRGQKKNKEALDIYHKVYDDAKANFFQKDEAERNLKELDPTFTPTLPAYLLPTPFPSPSGGAKELNPPTDFNPKPSPAATPAAPTPNTAPLPSPSATPPAVVR